MRYPEIILLSSKAYDAYKRDSLDNEVVDFFRKQGPVLFGDELDPSSTSPREYLFLTFLVGAATSDMFLKVNNDVLHENIFSDEQCINKHYEKAISILNSCIGSDLDSKRRMAALSCQCSIENSPVLYDHLVNGWDSFALANFSSTEMIIESMLVLGCSSLELKFNFEKYYHDYSVCTGMRDDWTPPSFNKSLLFQNNFRNVVNYLDASSSANIINEAVSSICCKDGYAHVPGSLISDSRVNTKIADEVIRMELDSIKQKNNEISHVTCNTLTELVSADNIENGFVERVFSETFMESLAECYVDSMPAALSYGPIAKASKNLNIPSLDSNESEEFKEVVNEIRRSIAMHFINNTQRYAEQFKGQSGFEKENIEFLSSLVCEYGGQKELIDLSKKVIKRKSKEGLDELILAITSGLDLKEMGELKLISAVKRIKVSNDFEI